MSAAAALAGALTGAEAARRMAEIQAVMTDIGGVVLAVHVDRGLAALASACGLDAEEVLPLLGCTDDVVERLYRGQWKLRDVHRRCGEPLRSVGYAQFADAWKAVLGEDYASVRRAYEALPPGVRLYTLSNTHDLHLDCLRSHWLHELSAGFFASCEIGMQKPDPEIFQYALGRIGLAGPAVVFFDDSEANVLAAAELGIRAVHVTDPEIVPRTLGELGVIG